MRIQTERLVIKEMSRADYNDFKEIVNDFRTGEYSMYNPPLPEDEEDIIEFFEYYLDYICVDAYGVYLNDEMIGLVTSMPCFNQFEIGYMFKTKCQGKGYAFESVKAVVTSLVKEYGFKIVAGTAMKNTPSNKLLNKLGFKCVSVEDVSFREGQVVKGCNYIY